MVQHSPFQTVVALYTDGHHLYEVHKFVDPGFLSLTGLPRGRSGRPYDYYIYDVSWMDEGPFRMMMNDGRPVDYENMASMALWIHQTCPEARRLEDLGQFPLGQRHSDGGIELLEYDSIPNRCAPIAPRNVPVGSFLASNALGFFVYWLGPSAVDTRRHLIVSPKNGPTGPSL